MLHRPTLRSRRDADEQINLNLVPMLDAMVTIVAFLLASMAIYVYVGVDSVVPLVAPNSQADQIKKKPLQLTVSIGKDDIEVWSPFKLIKSKTIRNKEDGKPDTLALHELMLGIKQGHPLETKVVLVPHKTVTYDILISIMDAVRLLEKTDPRFEVVDQSTGQSVEIDRLFPDVIFGNLLGD